MISSMRESGNAIQFILANLDDTRKVVRHAYAIRKRLVKLARTETICERDFYRIAHVLTPQSGSPIWQNYFYRGAGGRSGGADMTADTIVMVLTVVLSAVGILWRLHAAQMVMERRLVGRIAVVEVSVDRWEQHNMAVSAA